MINLKDNEWIPSAGFKYITNGIVYTDMIYLGSDDSIDKWNDTNNEPPEPDEQQATDADYQTALSELGVNI